MSIDPKIQIRKLKVKIANMEDELRAKRRDNKEVELAVDVARSYYSFMELFHKDFRSPVAENSEIAKAGEKFYAAADAYRQHRKSR